ncbi:uncharacterized protein P884DRAFT_318424 [Thermothelomyces heterothallicus CBS 202.75]|uniref:uncharacterized protein n=1 Tax=Thermothelomyces heterothallicus CBS 202.75 TaxID=1149848 RepID=UPI00374443CB
MLRCTWGEIAVSRVLRWWFSCGFQSTTRSNQKQAMAKPRLEPRRTKRSLASGATLCDLAQHSEVGSPRGPIQVGSIIATHNEVLSAPGRIEAACKLSKGMAELGLMELPAKLGLPAARTRFDELQAIYQLQAYATHYAQRCLESAGDPLFYPHHTWLDKVFWGWQARDSSTGTTTIGGTNIASDAPPGFLTRPSNIPLRAYWCRRRPWHNTTLGHVLNMYGNMPNATVGDVLDIQGDFLCYEYVEPEDEATSPAWSEPELGRDQKKDDDSEPRGAKEPNSLCEGAFQRFLTDFLKSAESAKWPCSINAPGKSGMRKERMELGRGTCRFRRETVEKMGY